MLSESPWGFMASAQARQSSLPLGHSVELAPAAGVTVWEEACGPTPMGCIWPHEGLSNKHVH